MGKKDMKNPSARQAKILKAIVEHHALSVQPVSSQIVIEKYLQSLSSATVRNEMVALEQLGLLEKTHTSSGRIPSVSGYRLYNESLDKTDLAASLKTRLRDVLSQRNTSINEVIAKSMAIISEVTNLTSVITETNADELLKRIDLVPISERSATVIVVTSAGTVTNNLITIDKAAQINDIAVCVRIFNDRLTDTKMGELAEKSRLLEPLIKKQIKNYEFFLQDLIEKIFVAKAAPSSKLIDIKNLTTQPEFRDINKLQKVIALLEDATV